MRTVDSAVLNFIRVVVDGHIDEVSRSLAANPVLATTPSGVGATRQEASTFFFTSIRHYLYAGDTAHLAVQNTGKRGSGSPYAREQQAGIVRLLLQRGAKPTDRDGKGKQVDRAATSEWIRDLLQ